METGADRLAGHVLPEMDAMERVVTRVVQAEAAYERALRAPVTAAPSHAASAEAARLGLLPYLAMHRAGALGGHLFETLQAGLARWHIRGPRRAFLASGLLVRLRTQHTPPRERYCLDGDGTLWHVEIAPPGGLVRTVRVGLRRAGLALVDRLRRVPSAHGTLWEIRVTRVTAADLPAEAAAALEELLALADATLALLDAAARCGVPDALDASVWMGRLRDPETPDAVRRAAMATLRALHAQAAACPHAKAVCQAIVDLRHLHRVVADTYGVGSPEQTWVHRTSRLLRDALLPALPRPLRAADVEAMRDGLRVALAPLVGYATWWFRLPEATRRRCLDLVPSRDEFEVLEARMHLKDMEPERLLSLPHGRPEAPRTGGG